MDAAVRTKARITAIAVASGVLVAILGIGPWAVLGSLNLRHAPETPWAAYAVLAWLVVLLAWLAGLGPPRVLARDRAFALRLWRPEPGAWSGARLGENLALIAAITMIYVVWIAVTPRASVEALAPYPTPQIRISFLLMGALVSGLVEEVAFRGYLQSRLERFGPAYAIGVTSLVFVLLHATHGLLSLIAMAPGYLVASLLYGLLAWRSGSILPGIALHVAGDGAHTFFGLLGGDASLLLMR